MSVNYIDHVVDQESEIEYEIVDTAARGDISELETDVSDLKSAINDIDETVNGAISKNYTEGKNFSANNSSHNIIDDSNACISDYIPVTWGTDTVAFWYTDDTEDATLYQMWSFDANKAFIGYKGRNPVGANYRSVAAESGAAYVRISFKKGFAGRLTENSLTPSTIYYVAEETVTSLGIVQKIGNLSGLNTSAKSNIVSAINEIDEDIYGHGVTETFTITSGVNKSVNFSASAGETILVTPSGTAFTETQCYIYFQYTGEGNTNMGLVDIGKATPFTLVKSLEKVFMYAAAAKTQAGMATLSVRTKSIVDDISANKEAIDKVNILSGLKINFLGDSLTHGPGNDNSNSYTTFLANGYGCTTRNYGIIGSTVQYDENRNPMCVRYANMDNDADIVAFMGGTNDYWNNKPLGQFGDTTYDTFYGALDVLISGLIAKYPSALVYAVTPPHGYGENFTGETKSQSGSMQDIADAIKKVSEKYSIPVLDVFNAGGLYPKISAQADVYYNSSDGVHLTVVGQKKLANLHAMFIEAHYCG